MGGYSNYKFTISHSIFKRMALWRTLCLQSNIEEVLCLSFYMFISSLWFSSLLYHILIYIFYLLIILTGIPLLLK